MTTTNSNTYAGVRCGSACNQCSNWTYEPLAFIAHHAVPQISRLLPSSTRQKMYNFLSTWEEAMLAEPTYRKRTWFGLNGIDQYDLVADCQHAMSKYL